ncbi:uncharacterized protein [Anoplolepis gracilipes]|uniref:uncharacterized protein n=1 Tax=Anoplolepis gracilipes TaxID=354296 RepID=UPI003B9E45FC
MLNSSPWHHTANMKLLLITFVVCFAAALAAPTDKKKREILPGDPRYGTDYHHHHHHHENENEVQISKAAGGYVGSFTVPEEIEGHSLQVQPLLSSYGPPNYNPGKPLGPDYASEAGQTSAVQVPATSYGVPDTQINNNYVESAVAEENKSSAVIKNNNLNVDYQVPSVEAPITSYNKHEELILPQTSYGTPVVKTHIHAQPQESGHVSKSVPNVHHEVHQHKETVSVPQVKATSHVPVETQGIEHSLSSLPSFGSSISSLPSYSFYSSYPSFSNIPVKTVDHRVQVQVPQPYPVPVTKHVTYPVPVPQAVEVPKPYYVRVAQPVPVTVNRAYPVEVPRPVAYPVPHYVRTNIPVLQHQHLNPLDVKASNPIEGLFENAQSTFQGVLGNFPNLPSFPNLETLQNAFSNFPGLPSFSLPSLPFTPQATPAPAPVTLSNVASNTDSVTIENPAETTKTAVVQPLVTHHAKVHQTTHSFKPTTTCAGCSVSSTHTSTKHKENVPSTADSNGGYNY